MLTFPVALIHEHDVDFLTVIYTNRSLFNIIMVVMVWGFRQGWTQTSL